MKKEPRKRKRYKRLTRIDYQSRTKLWSNNNWQLASFTDVLYSCKTNWKLL